MSKRKLALIALGLSIPTLAFAAEMALPGCGSWCSFFSCSWFQ